MQIITVQVEGLDGPCAYDVKNIEGVLAELKELLDVANLKYETDMVITVKVGEMDEQEFHALPEFAGY